MFSAFVVMQNYQQSEVSESLAVILLEIVEKKITQPIIWLINVVKNTFEADGELLSGFFFAHTSVIGFFTTSAGCTSCSVLTTCP